MMSASRCAFIYTKNYIRTTPVITAAHASGALVKRASIPLTGKVIG